MKENKPIFQIDIDILRNVVQDELIFMYKNISVLLAIRHKYINKKTKSTSDNGLCDCVDSGTDFFLQNETKIFLKRKNIEIQMLWCMKKCLYTFIYTTKVK